MLTPGDYYEILHEPDGVIGDVDAFIAYVESGQAAEDWNRRVAHNLRSLDLVFSERDNA